MVSTRRGATTAPPDDTLASIDVASKRPVRKATGKSTALSGAKTTNKKPSTRSKKTTEEPEDEIQAEEDEGASEIEVKPQIKRATKAKAPKAVPKSQKEVAAATKVQPRVVSRSLRGRPLQQDQEEDALDLKPEAISGKSGSKRTMATKAAPLSPKKVMQVAKAISKTAFSKVDENEGAKKQPLQTRTRTRSTTTRNTSDENEDVNIRLPQHEHTRMEDHGTDSESSTVEGKERTITTARKLPKRQAIRRNKTSQAVSSHKSFTPVKAQVPVAEESSPDELSLDSHVTQRTFADCERDTANSDDELLGPKTPMKRTSLNALSQWRASAQKSARPLQTPVRDLAARRIQLGTPQTQRLHERAAHNIDSAVPMTEARATGRSFVFRDLKPLREDDMENSTELEQPSLVHVQEEDSTIVEVPSLDEIVEESSIVDEPTPTAEAQALGPDVVSEDEDSSVLVAPELSIVAMSDHVDENSDLFSESAAGADDVNHHTALAADEVYSKAEDVDGTVIVTRQEDEEEESQDENDYIDRTEDQLDDTHFEGSEIDVSELDVSTFDATQQSIETIPWRRLRADVTIPVNFEAHLQGIDCLPQGSPTEKLDICGDTILAAQEQQRELQTEEPVVLDSSTDVEETSLTHVADDEDPSLHVSEFIDVASLAETTGQIDVPESGPLHFASAVEVNDVDMNDNMDVTGLIDDGRNEISVTDRSPLPEEDAVEQQCEESAVFDEEVIPHYARPTFAFDARRKSLPATMLKTPTKHHSRPHTSDGASVPRSFANWEEPWWIRSRREAQTTASVTGTPVRRQSTRALDHRSESKPSTPKKSSIAPSGVVTPETSTQERYPRLNSRSRYPEPPRTTIAPSKFRTPVHPSKRHPATVGKAVPDRFFKFGQTTPLTARTMTPGGKSTLVVNSPCTTPPQATTTERYPRLGARENYGEHAATVTAARFRTPTHVTPAKRSLTVQKAATSRKIPLQDTSYNQVRTPIKKQLKASAVTPSQEPMTPHPAAPLRGVVALVEVFTNEGASASAPFIQLLHRLGAKTTKSWGDRITHVVFKDGSPTTLQRVRLHNKEVAEVKAVHCVNSRWVTNCDTAGARLDETEEQYAVDLEELPRGGKRRRKSMEPSALANVGGSVVRDRHSSYGRSSFGRASLGCASIGPSPLKRQKSGDRSARASIDQRSGGEASGHRDSSQQQEDSSPVTPAWIAAPDTLVQQTAPLNRMRKLQVRENEKGNRRLTFFNGAF